MIRRPPRSTLFPTRRSSDLVPGVHPAADRARHVADRVHPAARPERPELVLAEGSRSEEHTSELQSPCNLVCRLLLEKKTDHCTTHVLLHIDLPARHFYFDSA